MPKLAESLGALQVQRLTEPGYYAVGGVKGLALQVTPTGARSWILRMVIGSKRREMGLGNYPGVSLADARKAAGEMRQLADIQGVDPIEHRKAKRSETAATQALAVTFEDCAKAYIKAHEAAWKNAKHIQQWRNTLEAYAYPVLGSLLVRDIAMGHVLKVLEPIWREKTETASRVRGRIAAVLDWAKGRGYRSGDNPAEWDGNLKAQLPLPEKIATVEHHAALPIEEVAVFMATLRKSPGMGARALEFVILTAARSGEVRGATWAEIDIEGKVWVVPADRMKAGREHRVPLSSAAVELLKALEPMPGSDFVFPAPRGGMLSDMTLSAVLRRMAVPAVPHGFRSTFRDWCSERTNYPREVAEMALAHTVGDKVEAAYRRGDLFEKRQLMMEDWAAHCARIERKGSVVSINRSAA